MKYYCYETDTAFTLCVDDVQDARLEAVIEHMAWRKADDKFLMSYPHHAFPNQQEKELISDNFVRVGQAVFESALNGFDWKKPLEMLAEVFSKSGIEWYIVGSAGDAVRGIDVKPFDIDIVIHTRDYWRVKDICYASFPDSVIAPFTSYAGEEPLEYFVCPLKYFGRLFLAGAMIDVAGDETWNMENRKPPYEKISWNGYEIYVDALELRYKIEIARNRLDRIRAIEAYMNHGKQ